jgi:hypothetical protein
MAGPVIDIPIDRIHLYEENPRHGQMTDPDEIIEYLLSSDQSIAEHETNPLELIGVVRLDDEDDTGEPTYEVWEGNRRVCAIMLLNDPELAPSRYRQRFEELAATHEPIQSIEGRVFDNRDELRFWMRNIHDGVQDGVGRKPWGPDEQHRDNPTRKNAIAFTLLEMAEEAGLITKSQRGGKLTTLQRYVGNPAIRDILLANDDDPANVVFGRTDAAMEKLLARLIDDLLSRNISSRHNEDEIIEYARSLEENAGVTDADNEEPESGEDAEPDDNDDDEADDGPAPPPPPAPTKVRWNSNLQLAINNSENQKLIRLYRSITTVSARTHTQLVAVGSWSLIETIAKICGANDDTSFDSFFSTQRLQNNYGLTRDNARTVQSRLRLISQNGNATKHHAISATFDYSQLIVDMSTVSDMLATALNHAAQQT